MKAKFFSFLLLITLLGGLAFVQPTPAAAETGTDTATVTDTSTSTPESTVTPEPSNTPIPSDWRPLVIIESYGTGSSEAILPGQEFSLRLRIKNIGKDFAKNVIFSFKSTDFLPLDSGGVRAINEMDPDERLDVVQPLKASPTLAGQSVATATVNLSYTNPAGTAYTETFTITINLRQPDYSGSVSATKTPTPISRPQLVVSGYKTDTDPLQPGSMFTLALDVINLGTSNARAVTMVLGGGVNPNDSGTPQPGISGSGSDLSVFAPLGSSNLVFLGDVPTGQTLKATQTLIVNVSANPGAYSLKISFVYDDAKGNRQVDDQVITLLIYRLPQVEVSFYRDPGIFFTGQPNILPLQVTNLGRNSTVLGNMKVTSANGEVTNNVALVGVLEPGGYFTLDANYMPQMPGPQTIDIVVNYTDDFNQPRSISQTLNVDVQEMPTMEPIPPEGLPGDDGMIPGAPETFWQKVVRFFKGLFGLGSDQPAPAEPLPGEIPPDQMQPGDSGPIIIGPKG